MAFFASKPQRAIETRAAALLSWPFAPGDFRQVPIENSVKKSRVSKFEIETILREELVQLRGSWPLGIAGFGLK